MMIKRIVNRNLYYDKHGTEITEGCTIKFDDGRVEIVYRTVDNELGIDATNRSWVERGLAVPCEYGIYPLRLSDTEEVEVVKC